MVLASSAKFASVIARYGVFNCQYRAQESLQRVLSIFIMDVEVKGRKAIDAGPGWHTRLGQCDRSGTDWGWRQ